MFKIDCSHYLYNSLSNSFFELNNELYEAIVEIKNKNIKVDCNILPEDLFNIFTTAKIIVKNDKYELNRLNQNIDKLRFSSEKVRV